MDELFARVYDDPDADEVREVLADALLDEGDPRGRFVALQLARHRARHRAGPPRGAFEPLPPEEGELLQAHAADWFGAHLTGSAFLHVERGFPRLARLHAADCDLTQVAEAPGVRTLVGLALGDRRRLPLDTDEVGAFLLSPALRHLRDLRHLDPTELYALAGAAFQLDTVALCRAPEAGELASWLDGVTALRMPWSGPEMSPDLDAPSLSLDVGGPPDDLDAWLGELCASVRTVWIRHCAGQLVLERDAVDAWVALLDRPRLSLRLLTALPSARVARPPSPQASYLAEESELEEIDLERWPTAPVEILDGRGQTRSVPEWPELIVSYRFWRFAPGAVRWALEQPVARLRFRAFRDDRSALVLTRAPHGGWSDPVVEGPLTFALAQVESQLSSLGLRRRP